MRFSVHTGNSRGAGEGESQIEQLLCPGWLTAWLLFLGIYLSEPT